MRSIISTVNFKRFNINMVKITHVNTLLVNWSCKQDILAMNTKHPQWTMEPYKYNLTHWGRVTHICVSNLTIIASDNGLSPGRRQAIIWTSAGILLIRPLWTNFSEILIGIQTFSFKKMHLKMSCAKWRPFCLGLNELKQSQRWCTIETYQ